MDRLPDEVILAIISFLDVRDIVRLQSASARYLTLGRDNALWRAECFNHSRAEAIRRRQHMLNVADARLAELRNAVNALPGNDGSVWDTSQNGENEDIGCSSNPAQRAITLKHRAVANWEPSYPNESLDYYTEFIHRHAPIHIEWLDLPKSQSSSGRDGPREATGLGTLAAEGSDDIQHAVAPLDDGSICIWDLSARTVSYPGGQGKLVGQSRSGLLTGRGPGQRPESHIIMTETGAVECVSIDSSKKKGYFAVQSLLQEVDLNTLQVTSTRQYPFPITALSEAKAGIPVTVGTNWTIHLNDPRDPACGGKQGDGTGAELIGGNMYSHAILAQPGPLSILHDTGLGYSEDSSIWVAGRFTSLLNYDRRAFPRLVGTIHSGARIASLASLPFPLVPRSLDLIRHPEVSTSAFLEAKSKPGKTILAAGEYKGKGSLELYGLPRVEPYQNRQTASASKLLAVAAHGGMIVFSDGDGNLKWAERDGFTTVRTFNINEHEPKDVSDFGIWSSTTSELPGQGDIVQKIIPSRPLTVNSKNFSPKIRAQNDTDINQSDLLLWTGDGRIGVLGYGRSGLLGGRVHHDILTSQALSAGSRAKEDAERQYGMAMRRALERNADEVRFVRGLGMGFMRH
ncbi:hypothetical protein M433DRAFT_106274 [Acidomyces richmondensis BFW]|nr:hypothetical protein M433DRAFT_106274 [Acidomyces richmondensis BFW]